MEDNKKILLASKDLIIEDSRKREFCKDERIEEITGIQINEENPNYDLEISNLCRENPYDILRLSDFTDIKRRYVDAIAEGIFARLPYKKSFLGKKIEILTRDALDDEELENARTALMQIVNFSQSEKIDQLCMTVMTNPYRLSEAKLNNWLDLLIKNSSNQLLAHLSSLIDSIKNDRNLPEEIQVKFEEEKEKIIHEYKHNKSNGGWIKRALLPLKAVEEACRDKISEIACRKAKKGEYMAYVFNRLPLFYHQLDIPDTPFVINSTLGYVQSILENVENFEKFVPDLQRKREDLIFNIARSVSIDSQKSGSKDAYARIFDLSIKYLREQTTIKDVLDTLFNFQDTFTVIDKAKIVLENWDGKKYSRELILSVAYKFVDLYNSLPEEKQNYRDSILTILMDFILSNSELNYEVFDYLENTSTDIKTVTKIIKKMLLQTNLPLDLPAVHKRILEDSDNNFDDAQKRLSFYTLFENYNSLSKEKQTYIFEFFISAVCGEFNVPPHLREEMAKNAAKKGTLTIMTVL